MSARTEQKSPAVSPPNVTDTVLVYTAPPGGAIQAGGYFGASLPLSDFVQTSVLTTKGDILGDNGTAPTRIPVGANGTVLTANSAVPLGVQWEVPSSLAPTLNSVQYAQVGTGPGTVAAGQPLTYGSTPVPGPVGNFTLTTAAGQGPFTDSGSVVTITKAGTYLVSFQQNANLNASVGIYYGASLGAMAPLPYTLVGGANATAQTGGTFIVPVAAGSFLAVCAAAGNSAAISPYANPSTTNASSVSLALVQIA